MVKQGNRIKYTSAKGQEVLEFRKGWDGEKLQMIMDDISSGGVNMEMESGDSSTEVEEVME